MTTPHQEQAMEVKRLAQAKREKTQELRQRQQDNLSPSSQQEQQDLFLDLMRIEVNASGGDVDDLRQDGSLQRSRASSDPSSTLELLSDVEGDDEYSVSAVRRRLGLEKDDNDKSVRILWNAEAAASLQRQQPPNRQYTTILPTASSGSSGGSSSARKSENLLEAKFRQKVQAATDAVEEKTGAPLPQDSSSEPPPAAIFTTHQTSPILLRSQSLRLAIAERNRNRSTAAGSSSSNSNGEEPKQQQQQQQPEKELEQQPQQLQQPECRDSIFRKRPASSASSLSLSSSSSASNSPEEKEGEIDNDHETRDKQEILRSTSSSSSNRSNRVMMFASNKTTALTGAPNRIMFAASSPSERTYSAPSVAAEPPARRTSDAGESRTSSAGETSGPTSADEGSSNSNSNGGGLPASQSNMYRLALATKTKNLRSLYERYDQVCRELGQRDSELQQAQQELQREKKDLRRHLSKRLEQERRQKKDLETTVSELLSSLELASQENTQLLSKYQALQTIAQVRGTDDDDGLENLRQLFLPTAPGTITSDAMSEHSGDSQWPSVLAHRSGMLQRHDQDQYHETTMGGGGKEDPTAISDTTSMVSDQRSLDTQTLPDQGEKSAASKVTRITIVQVDGKTRSIISADDDEAAEQAARLLYSGSNSSRRQALVLSCLMGAAVLTTVLFGCFLLVTDEALVYPFPQRHGAVCSDAPSFERMITLDDEGSRGTVSQPAVAGESHSTTPKRRKNERMELNEEKQFDRFGDINEMNDDNHSVQSEDPPTVGAKEDPKPLETPTEDQGHSDQSQTIGSPESQGGYFSEQMISLRDRSVAVGDTAGEWMTAVTPNECLNLPSRTQPSDSVEIQDEEHPDNSLCTDTEHPCDEIQSIAEENNPQVEIDLSPIDTAEAPFFLDFEEGPHDVPSEKKLMLTVSNPEVEHDRETDTESREAMALPISVSWQSVVSDVQCCEMPQFINPQIFGTTDFDDLDKEVPSMTFETISSCLESPVFAFDAMAARSLVSNLAFLSTGTKKKVFGRRPSWSSQIKESSDDTAFVSVLDQFSSYDRQHEIGNSIASRLEIASQNMLGETNIPTPFDPANKHRSALVASQVTSFMKQHFATAILGLWHGMKALDRAARRQIGAFVASVQTVLSKRNASVHARIEAGSSS